MESKQQNIQEKLKSKLKFEQNPYILKEIEKLQDLKTEQELQKVSISLEMLSKIQSVLKENKILKINLKEQQNTIESLNISINQKSEKMRNNQDYLQKIDSVYVEKQKEFELKLEQQLKKNEQEINDLKQANNELVEKLKQKEQAYEFYKKKALEFENQCTQARDNTMKLLVQMEEIRTEMFTLKQLRTSTEISPEFNQKSQKNQFINLFFQKKSKTNLMQFLSAADMVSISLTNKFLYFSIQRDFQLSRIIMSNQNKYYQKQIKNLLRENNYFEEWAQQVDSNILKVAVLKFICQRVNMADYIVPHFQHAEKFLETGFNQQQQQQQKGGNEQKQKSEADSASSQSTQDSALNIQDYPFLKKYFTESQQQQQQQSNSDVQQNNNSIAEKKDESKREKTKNFFKNLKNIIKGKDEEDGLENAKDVQQKSGLQQQSQSKNRNNQQSGQLIKPIPDNKFDYGSQNKVIRQIDCDLQINEFNMDVLEDERKYKRQFINSEIQKYMNLFNEVTKNCQKDAYKLYFILENMHSCFLNLLVYSKLLFSDSKELLELQYYLVSKVMEKNKHINIQSDQIDDLKIIQQSDSKMKAYLNQRVKDQDQKILRQEQELYQKKNQLEEVQEKWNEEKTLAQNVQEEKVQKEKKIQILAQELKKLMQKNEELVKQNTIQSKMFNGIQKQLREISTE